MTSFIVTVLQGSHWLFHISIFGTFSCFLLMVSLAPVQTYFYPTEISVTKSMVSKAVGFGILAEC